jgi:hypothetical protein
LLKGTTSLAAEKSRLAYGHGFTGCGKNPVLLKGTASLAAEKVLVVALWD